MNPLKGFLCLLHGFISKVKINVESRGEQYCGQTLVLRKTMERSKE